MRRCGVTLVELLVSLAVLGVVLALVSTTLRRTESPSTSPDLHAQLRRAQQSAADAGVPVTLTIVDATGVHAATVNEMGLVTGDSSLHAALFADSASAIVRQMTYAR